MFKYIFRLKSTINLNSQYSQYKSFNLLNLSIRKFTTKKTTSKSKVVSSNVTKKKSFIKGLKDKVKVYGLFGIYCYIFTYIATFGIFYAMTKLKLINSQKFFIKADEWGLNEYIDVKGWQDKLGPTYSDLVVAILINEMVEVIRLPLLVAMLPRIVKRFKK